MHEQARQLLSLLDLTSLNESDTEVTIAHLCSRAVTAFGRVAAVCVWPPFVPFCKGQLAGTGVRVATVANFPHGRDRVEQALAETQAAVAAGADEVDVVFPYRSWLAGARAKACELVAACKEACGPGVVLKVILETGELQTPAHITAASRDTIAAGADFLKTSTGKVKTGATLAAATCLLAAIREADRPIGFKAAGGIRTVAAALPYLELAERLMGSDWVRPDTFRIGASALWDDLVAVLTHEF
jgi:deoxyribose-phosphate aldolase